ncbi:MAG: hypothetical protein A3K59_05335 [Euryarchaeota archaeon RBG_19FT_COMBO_69_17]|nr:MAG: hypothetical protein A3K59_05335 [Euryarchaeota archaeon RBG_19FT_COMBO_69_17]
MGLLLREGPTLEADDDLHGPPEGLRHGPQGRREADPALDGPRVVLDPEIRQEAVERLYSVRRGPNDRSDGDDAEGTHNQDAQEPSHAAR